MRRGTHRFLAHLLQLGHYGRGQRGAAEFEEQRRVWVVLREERLDRHSVVRRAPAKQRVKQRLKSRSVAG